MPSLRKRVSSYFRQLSFHNEPKESRNNMIENSFLTKYLQGKIALKEGPPILYGKNPTDLPNYDLGVYETGPETVVGCYTGPNGGLTTVKRSEKHLSITDADIDFIDTQDETSEDPEKDRTHICAEEDTLLPQEWNIKSDFVFGLSDSLYDKNQVTRNKNGDPIADCFGVIARSDSAILALADGVNWGEKACLAAKSAIHGCLHYLNKTIFNDTKPFQNLVKNQNDEAPASFHNSNTSLTEHRINNTREVFICLLRAFNCAHDLILENNGMLTTLTVAVVLPLSKSSGNQRQFERFGRKQPDRGEDQPPTSRSDRCEGGLNEETYICCVCNVGDTLAYVYSQKYGIRELTKGSHDISCNRDMRDALGALGPVDGINPELSNLTLSITTLQKGDIVLIASDGLTDNFDPNVCRFSSNLPESKKKPATPHTQTKDARKPPESVSAFAEHTNASLKREEKPENAAPSPSLSEKNKPPVKPPRKNVKNRDSSSRSSAERSDRESMERSLVSKTLPVVMSNNEKPTKANPDPELENPLIAQFVRANSVDKSSSLLANLEQNKNVESKKKPGTSHHHHQQHKSLSSSQRLKPHHAQARPASSLARNPQTKSLRSPAKAELAKKPEAKTISPPKYNFLRSKTSLDLRSKPILRNEEGVPYVTPVQRYELTLLLIEDILRKGISGNESQCVNSRKLCENLVSFTFSITSAKRHTLEDNDLYFDNRNGVLVEVSSQEKKLRRRKGLDRVQNLPGKLDHVSVVAYNVGNCSF